MMMMRGISSTRPATSVAAFADLLRPSPFIASSSNFVLCGPFSRFSTTTTPSKEKMFLRGASHEDISPVSPTGAPHLIIAGPPGSGKGTLCEKLKDHYNLAHLSTGDLLRAAIADGTELGKKVDAIISKGLLAPDNLMIDVVSDRLSRLEKKGSGWLLDGFPRTDAQAKALAESGINVHGVVLLEPQEQWIVDRIVHRRTDPVTGKVYNMKYNPPPPDVDVTRLTHRKDDTIEVLQTRLATFKKQKQSIIEPFKEKVVVLSGEGGPDDVFNDAKAKLDVLLAKMSKKGKLQDASPSKEEPRTSTPPIAS